MSRTKKLVFTAVSAAVAVAAGGLAGASMLTAGESNQQIQACVSKGLLGIGTGGVRIVSSPTQCRSNKDPLSWNETGPAGHAGADRRTGRDRPARPGGPRR